MMSPFSINAPRPAPASHHRPQVVNAVPDLTAAFHGLAVSHHDSSLPFDETIKKKLADNDGRILEAVSRSWFPNPEAKAQCLYFVKHLRVHRNLFMHTYVHLVTCCRSERRLRTLVDNANRWKGLRSVQQLTQHSLIRENILSFWTDTCVQHKHLHDQHLVIREDDSDFLCLLLYCARKPELYKLPKGQRFDLKEPEQAIELLWQFVTTPQESNIARRLRALIYRMARKTAYLPRALRIEHSSISNKRNLAVGGFGMVMTAQMNGRNIVIKKILCRDRARQRESLERFSGEAILWGTLQHKNIVPFLGIISEGTFDIGLVSPFFKNGNIQTHLKTHDPKYWPALARKWGRDIAEGLEYIHCHEPPVVHGDLKGDNVLVDDAGHARLTDFGQSHASLADSRKYLDSAHVARACCPVHWMAPEVLTRPGANASDKSDIFAFGCVLYEMVSGKVPFEGHTPESVASRVSRGEHPNKPESIRRNDPLWKMAESCWNNRPEGRPSATDIVSFFH